MISSKGLNLNQSLQSRSSVIISNYIIEIIQASHKSSFTHSLLLSSSSNYYYEILINFGLPMTGSVIHEWTCDEWINLRGDDDTRNK